MGQVHRSAEADIDLDAIGEYIGRQSDSVQTAVRFLAELRQTLESYARQPLMRELRDDLGPEIRMFAFRRNYVVLYRPLHNGIDVLRVFHAARDYPRLFHGDA